MDVLNVSTMDLDVVHILHMNVLDEVGVETTVGPHRETPPPAITINPFKLDVLNAPND